MSCSHIHVGRARQRYPAGRLRPVLIELELQGRHQLGLEDAGRDDEVTESVRRLRPDIFEVDDIAPLGGVAASIRSSRDAPLTGATLRAGGDASSTTGDVTGEHAVAGVDRHPRHHDPMRDGSGQAHVDAGFVLPGLLQQIIQLGPQLGLRRLAAKDALVDQPAAAPATQPQT